jgi:hypothetical protein
MTNPNSTHYWDDETPLTAEEIAGAARAEAMLQPLVEHFQAQRAAEIAAMATLEPLELEEVPLKLREAILGPQRGSAVTVTLDDGHVLLGRLERYEPETDTVEVDFWGWYGEFQVTHCVAEIRLDSTGKLITSPDGNSPLTP